jgi:hypothetical protein
VGTIISEFYKGQGLGNQLYTYASVRGIAKMCNKKYAFLGVENFKGNDLFDIDFGNTCTDYPKTKLYEYRLIDPSCRHDVGVTDFDLIRKIALTKESVKIEGLLAGKGYWFGEINFLKEIFSFRDVVNHMVDEVEHDLVMHIRGGDFLYSNSVVSG